MFILSMLVERLPASGPHEKAIHEQLVKMSEQLETVTVQLARLEDSTRRWG